MEPKKTETPSKILKKERRKELSKLRSRVHRKRKQDYITLLENKISDLEKEVVNLTNQNEEYKRIIELSGVDIGSLFAGKEFKQDENFAFKEGARMITERPELVKHSFYLQLWQGYGPNSKSRKEFIEKGFDMIIDHGVSDNFKIGFAIHKNLTPQIEELILKCSEMPKYQMTEIQNQNDMPEIYRIICQPEQVSLFKKAGPYNNILKEGYKELYQYIHSLVELRDKIFMLDEKLHNDMEKAIEELELETLNNMTSYCGVYRKDKFLNKFHLWDLKKEEKD